MAAIISIVETEITQSSPVPIYVLLVGGVGIVVGLATFGARVIATVGSRITELTPSRGFAATLAAAATVVLASYTGLPGKSYTCWCCFGSRTGKRRGGIRFERCSEYIRILDRNLAGWWNPGRRFLSNAKETVDELLGDLKVAKEKAAFINSTF